MNKLNVVLPVAFALLFIAEPALAQEAGANAHKGMIGLGAGLAIGLAALGGALGQGNAAKGVYESISRNPNAAGKLNAPFYVGMAFIESLVIFAFVIAFSLYGLAG